MLKVLWISASDLTPGRYNGRVKTSGSFSLNESVCRLYTSLRKEVPNIECLFKNMQFVT
jgi:hypothetical protein